MSPDDENEHLNPDDSYNDNVSVTDEDEGIFQHAIARNHYQATNVGGRPSSVVTYSEVDPPTHSTDNIPNVEEELSTRDSGAGTGTGWSSGNDTK